jgi:hypothetical protein
MKAFWWDEVDYELRSVEIGLPDGLTPRQALVLIEDEIVQQLGENVVGMCEKTVRQVDDVFVLERQVDDVFAFSGFSGPTRIYWSSKDFKASKELALKELDGEE